jgi:hypothetical protein
MSRDRSQPTSRTYPHSEYVGRRVKLLGFDFKVDRVTETEYYGMFILHGTQTNGRPITIGPFGKWPG